MPIASISTSEPDPKMATTTIANNSAGNAITTSRVRMIKPSIKDFEVAASSPSSPPITKEIRTAPDAIVRDMP
jgi:hypothetical protein